MVTSYLTPTLSGGIAQKTQACPCEIILGKTAAGAATNDTFYFYIPILAYRSLGLQVPNWVAGAGGGTLTLTVEATCMPISECTTTGAYDTLTYADVTLALYGAASFTDVCVLTDSFERIKNFTVVRVKVVIANKDASTAWSLYAKLNT